MSECKDELLEWLKANHCTCHEDYTTRGLTDPTCWYCDWDNYLVEAAGRIESLQLELAEAKDENKKIQDLADSAIQAIQAALNKEKAYKVLMQRIPGLKAEIERLKQNSEIRNRQIAKRTETINELRTILQQAVEAMRALSEQIDSRSRSDMTMDLRKPMLKVDYALTAAEKVLGEKKESSMPDKDISDECCSCGEEIPKNDCPKSKRLCGHHCNCSWIHDACCWCGKEFGEESEGDDDTSCG